MQRPKQILKNDKILIIENIARRIDVQEDLTQSKLYYPESKF